MSHDKNNPVYCTWIYRESLPPATRDQFRDLDHFVRQLCSSATRQLFLVAPYLSCAGLESLRPAIATAAQNGAWIRLLTSDLNNNNGTNRRALNTLVYGNEGALIRNRLRILTATDKLPALIHAKIILVDHARGYLGSANLSQSALDQNFELGVALPENQVRSLESLLAYFEAQGLITDISEGLKQ
jgi:phosphatidylserine/phosphatidylglycerophosphate/cardiolipin synthase-like enzyme